MKKMLTLILLLTGLLTQSAEPAKKMTNEESKAVYNEIQTLIKRSDLKKAKELALSIESEDPKAYLYLTKIAELEIQKNRTEDTARKIIEYARKGIAEGYLILYMDLAFGYSLLGDFQKAEEYYKKSLDVDTENMDAAVAYARFLCSMLEDPEKAAEGVKIYRDAVKKNNPTAILELALAYMTGHGTKVQIKEAVKLCSQFINNPTPVAYKNDAHHLLGIIYEQGLLDGKPNLDKALEHFKKDEVSGKLDIARLILTNKIDGNKEEALNDLETGANNQLYNAVYMYSTLLIIQGNRKKGIQVLTDYYKNLPALMHPLIRLQLAIALHDDKKNKARADEEFKKIMALKDISTRSRLLTKAYMYIMGLGVPRDLDQGFRLLEESKTKYDDVSFDTYALFPNLKKIEEEYRKKKLALQEQLFKDDKEAISKKTKDKNKAKKSTPKKSQEKKENAELAQEDETSAIKSDSGVTPKTDTVPQDIFDTNLEYWNNFWAKDGDGSFVSEINRAENEITIEDPNRHEQLIVHVEEKPYSSPQNLTEFIYDPRIKQRQDDDLVQGQTHHIFAKILDYVIQCAGKTGFYSKKDSKDSYASQQMIEGSVTRVNTQTGKRTPTTAEYTFYEDSEHNMLLYHRLLRPIK